jgi:hypothetical protein
VPQIGGFAGMEWRQNLGALSTLNQLRVGPQRLSPSSASHRVSLVCNPRSRMR